MHYGIVAPSLHNDDLRDGCVNYRGMQDKHFSMYTLEQGSPNWILESQCPAEFGFNPNQTHLNQLIIQNFSLFISGGVKREILLAFRGREEAGGSVLYKRGDPATVCRAYLGLTGKHGCGSLSGAATDLSPAVMASALTPCRKHPS